MEIFRVGGAVRDMLRGYPPKDHDFVVVGGTVAEFLRYFPMAKQVGKSFPVFQINDGGTVSEFAFARRERKTGLGHQAFEVEADASVTLEEDLYRRDLTINALALPMRLQENKSLESQVIDPYGGVSDLRQGVLRPVSSHFAEDPLRVYRLARFAAQLNYVIEPSAYRLVATIPSDDIYALSGERVGEETRKAIRSPRPARYFMELMRLGVLGLWMPELLQLVGTPAGPPAHHAELDAFVHTMMVLEYAAEFENLDDEGRELVRWGALTHDLGKGLTPPEEWPAHHEHEERGVHLVQKFYDRLRLPAAIRDAAVVACADHLRAHRFTELRKGKMVDLIRRADRTRLRAEGLAYVAIADAMGRDAMVKDISGPKALLVAREETGHPIPEALKGENIGLHIRARKGAAVVKALKAAGCL